MSEWVSDVAEIVFGESCKTAQTTHDVVTVPVCEGGDSPLYMLATHRRINLI